MTFRVSLVSLTAALLVSAAPASAQLDSANVSLTKKTVRAGYNKKTSVSGRLTSGGTPVAGAVLVVTQNAGGRTTELGRTTTGNDGRFKHKFRAKRGGKLVVAYSAQAGGPVTSSARARLSVKPRLSISTRVRNRKLTLLGAVAAGNVRGALIQIQARDGRRWRVVGNVRVSKFNLFRWRYAFQSQGQLRFTFRAVMPYQKGYATGKSDSATVTVR